MHKHVLHILIFSSTRNLYDTLLFHVEDIKLCCRFEPDMLAFSGCYYGGGDKERRELAAIRRRWKTLHVMPILDCFKKLHATND